MPPTDCECAPPARRARQAVRALATGCHRQESSRPTTISSSTGRSGRGASARHRRTPRRAKTFRTSTFEHAHDDDTPPRNSGHPIPKRALPSVRVEYDLRGRIESHRRPLRELVLRPTGISSGRERNPGGTHHIGKTLRWVGAGDRLRFASQGVEDEAISSPWHAPSSPSNCFEGQANSYTNAIRSIGRAGITSPSMTGCHGTMLTATSGPQRPGSGSAMRSAVSAALGLKQAIGRHRRHRLAGCGDAELWRSCD